MPQLPKTTLKLTFEEWPGVEIVAGSVTLARAFELDELSPAEQLDGLAEVLVTWNITDEHERLVPCSGAGLRSLEVGHAHRIFRAWLDAITDVPAPLAPRSDNSLPWEVGSIPTEALS